MTLFRFLVGRLRTWWGFLFACILAAVAIHLWILAGYMIPTDSMEPTFHGDSSNGDRVAVFKPYYKLFEPERFDLVAFSEGRLGEAELNDKGRKGSILMVKRVAAFPGELIQIRDGDLFIGIEQPERFRKPVPQVLDLLIPVYRSQFDGSFWDNWQSLVRVDGDLKVDEEAREKAWTFAEKALICNAARPDLGGRRISLAHAYEIGDAYLDVDDAFHPGSFAVKDLSITLECEILSGGSGSLFADLSLDGDQMGFVLLTREAGGGGRINIKFGSPEGVDIDPARFPGLEPGRRYTIQFLNVDNRAALICDGTLLASVDYELEGIVPWFNNPWFGVKGLETAFFSVSVDRDIHYTRRGMHACREPYRVPEGSYFLLGDNSPSSGDSRLFGGVSAENIVGRPILVFYPFGRFRIL